MSRGSTSWLVGGLSPEAIESYASLLVTLARLSDDGVTPPCTDPARGYWWTEGDAEEREAATHYCQTCPVLAACRTHAETAREDGGVWAGVDRTQPTRRPKETATCEQ